MKTLSTMLIAGLAMSLTACSTGSNPIDTFTKPSASASTAAATSTYDPKPASPRPGGTDENGDYVGEEYSWGMFDDPKTAFPVTIEHAHGSTKITKP